MVMSLAVYSVTISGLLDDRIVCALEAVFAEPEGESLLNKD